MQNLDNELEKQGVVVGNAFCLLKIKFTRFTRAIIGGKKTQHIKIFFNSCFIYNFIIHN